MTTKTTNKYKENYTIAKELYMVNYFNYECIKLSKRKEPGSGAGYSGSALFSKLLPIRVMYGLDTLDEPNIEGRCITSGYEDFYLVNVYTPNSVAKNNKSFST